MAITQPGTVTPITNNAFPTPTVINTSAVQAPTAQSVYSADNINQAVTNPVQAPVSAEQQLYNQFLATPEIAGAKKQVSDIQAQINAANQAFRNAKTGFEYQNEGAIGTTGASANLIGRQIGRASDLTSNQVAALSENLKAQQAYLQGLTSEAQDRYNIAQNERSQIQSLITATKGKANITYTDSYEDALKKAAKYEEKVLKEEKKQAEKDELKKTAKSLGIKTSGLSSKEIEKKLNKYMKSEKAKEEEISKIELALKKKELAKPYYAPTGSDGDDKLVKAFESDVERLQTQMDKENGGIDWSYSWNYINNKYPGFSPQEIDEVLGLNYRSKFEG